MCLALELRAGRMIRPVNQDVAVEAGARGQLRARGGRPGLLGAVDSRDMPPARFAPLLIWAPWSPLWQSWQSQGARALSSGALLEPCGVWQLVQSSATGACSQRTDRASRRGRCSRCR